MDKKIIFFDIDGTLINYQNGLVEPTQKTKYVIEEFRKQGGLAVIASARAVLPFDDSDIKFDGYIHSEGHYIILNDEVLVDQSFDTKQVERQMDVYAKYNGRPMFYSREEQWNSFLDDQYVIEHRLMFSGTDERPTDVIEEFEAKDVHAISCCVLFESIEDMDKAYQELKDELTMVRYEQGLIRMDVYNKGFTKGTACEYIYQKLGVSKDNTYAFGDGENDLGMFKMVGKGIAMGNGVDTLKAIAYDVTDSVDNDGIAQALEKHFGIKYE
ncbi:MAG: HAD family hydrolase [Coprobacillus sp.]